MFVREVLMPILVGVVAGALMVVLDAPTWACVGIGYLAFLAEVNASRPEKAS